nr:MAG TPA: hypothetical protein [Bacteriophage sp.]DAT90896.1 MAG TPA: hypothetical protein [Bacteriophage sp.]DAW61798.1 MAG TPA: hypothetical protein [Caudoviricetes sp.]
MNNHKLSMEGFLLTTINSYITLRNLSKPQYIQDE